MSDKLDWNVAIIGHDLTQLTMYATPSSILGSRADQNP